MDERPALTNNLLPSVFLNFYYLKEELVDFCKENNLPVTGNKEELNNRIFIYLDSGKIIKNNRSAKKRKLFDYLDEDTLIEPNFVCSEIHRAFFKEKIGNSFSFNVTFQKWLKANTNKTYRQAIEAYYNIIEDKKKTKTTIDKHFEYNTYIRDFFSDNKGYTLSDAIRCWKYKKSLAGHNKYERIDLEALTKVN